MFETLLVVDGEPLELEAHLARLKDSLTALFEAPLPASARERAVDGARGARLARLRLTIAPDVAGELAAEVVVAAVDPALVLPDWEHGIELQTVTVAGGIGAHKWADRRLLAALEAQAAPRLPLLLDEDGTVLEASRGNLFAVRDGTLLTPPADGRILPGVTRGRVLLVAEALGLPAREERLPLATMLDSAEVFLTGAVRGVEPVRGCDGALVASEERVTTALAHELDLQWQGGGSHVGIG